MATMNSSVLACNCAISGPEINSKINLSPFVATPARKMPVIKAQQKVETVDLGRRAAFLGIGVAIFTAAISTSSANAGVIDDYLEKSKANKELNNKKRLATSGANFARAYTVQFGTCKFPENFTGCHDLAKQKKVPFLSDDLALECEGGTDSQIKCSANGLSTVMSWRIEQRPLLFPSDSPACFGGVRGLIASF